MKTLKLDEIEAGSIWKRADGSAVDVQVIGFDFDTDDVLVQDVVGSLSHVTRKVDTFKFQCRYDIKLA